MELPTSTGAGAAPFGSASFSDAGAASTEESGTFPSLDVAHLRRRIESYDGVVLLGADDRSQIDPGIARQCDEVVDLEQRPGGGPPLA